MPPLTIARMPLQLGSGRKNAVSSDGSDKRTALLVAGINYPRWKYGNEEASAHRTYFDYCVNYKTYLLDNDKVDRVVIFDFLNGETLFFEKGGDPKGQLNFLYGKLHPKNFRYVDPDPLKRGRPVGSTLKVKRVPKVRRYYFTSIDDLAKEKSKDPDADVPYDEYSAWNGGSEKSMSISDVYEMFTRGPSSGYQELHFFGHATHDGPVLVNTDEYGSKFYDKDARRRDFENTHLDRVFGPSNIDNSRASFRSDPVVCIWGCDVDNDALELIKQIEAKDAKKQNYDAEVKKVREKLADLYAARLARAMRFKVLCALPGMDAVHEPQDVDPTPYKFQPTAMHVAFSRHERYMKLYQKYLGTKFANTGAFKGHPQFGRGYAIFEP